MRVGGFSGRIQRKFPRSIARICLPPAVHDFSSTPTLMFRQRSLQELRTKRAQAGTKSAIVGFDGFVDTIVTAVGLRRGQGENFTPIGTIAEFGQRIVAAAGKSTNLEFYPRMDKLGGNGPIMA